MNSKTFRAFVLTLSTRTGVCEGPCWRQASLILDNRFRGVDQQVPPFGVVILDVYYVATHTPNQMLACTGHIELGPNGGL